MRIAAMERGGIAAGLGWIGENFAAERARWTLWLPVGLGLGVALYFALPVEPPAYAGAASLIPLVLLWAGIKRRPALALLVIALGCVVLGFSAAQLRTYWRAAPILERETGPAILEGRLIRLERRLADARLIIAPSRFGHDDAAVLPAKVRVRVLGALPPIRPGDTVRVRARLRPPPPPAAPGAFDFARRAYFQQIGGVGYAVGRVTVAERADGGRAGQWVERLRQHITERIRLALPGTEGGIAAALLTGERGTIPAPVLAALRDAGLAHLLAISGLHIGLVAGIAFFTIRLGLALSERLALERSIKKWAAGAALVVAFLYLVLSGAAVPGQRAFIMVSLVLLAVMLDRTAISMRLVAWAAAIILLTAPESLMGASFQMSFAAVIALVAAYEAVRDRPREERLGPRRRRIAIYFAGICLSTVVASLATAPFAAYLFNRIALYGLAANFIAVPLTGFWIMPLGMMALLLMPFGLEPVALIPMGWGIDLVVRVAETVAGWPGATLLVPALAPAGLALVTFGALWLCLWRRRWRLAGVPILLLGLIVFGTARTPDILVSADARLWAVKTPDGRLALSDTRRSRFIGEVWLRRAGQAAPAPWPPGRDKTAPWLRCDRLGCIYRGAGTTAALVRASGALFEDCAIADLVISAVPVGRRCVGPRRLIDRFDLWRNGAHAVFLAPGLITVENVALSRGVRPWAPMRQRK